MNDTETTDCSPEGIRLDALAELESILAIALRCYPSNFEHASKDVQSAHTEWSKAATEFNYLYEDCCAIEGCCLTSREKVSVIFNTNCPDGIVRYSMEKAFNQDEIEIVGLPSPQEQAA